MFTPVSDRNRETCDLRLAFAWHPRRFQPFILVTIGKPVRSRNKKELKKRIKERIRRRSFVAVVFPFFLSFQEDSINVTRVIPDMTTMATIV
jgi:hypothetical protein